MAAVATLTLGIACSSGGDNEPTPSTDTSNDGSSPDLPVLYIGLMVHLENHPSDTQADHDAYRDEILEYADLFDEFGAKPTWEVKEPILDCKKFNDPYFKLLEARGHGIGVHADLGGNPTKDRTVEEMTAQLTQMREGLEWQGVTVRHVSGICSHLDWVQAAIDAGYEFVTGVVDYCTQSLDLVPEEYSHCTSAGACHGPYGKTMADRMRPWRAQTSQWTQADSNGELIILPSAVEGLPHLSPDQGAAKLTSTDVDLYMEALDEALTLVEPNKLNTFFLLWSYGPSLDMDQMRDWLERIEPYVLQGKVAWKTLPEMVDAHVAWEAAQE